MANANYAREPQDVIVNQFKFVGGELGTATKDLWFNGFTYSFPLKTQGVDEEAIKKLAEATDKQRQIVGYLGEPSIPLCKAIVHRALNLTQGIVENAYGFGVGAEDKDKIYGTVRITKDDNVGIYTIQPANYVNATASKPASGGGTGEILATDESNSPVAPEKRNNYIVIDSISAAMSYLPK